MICLLLSLSLFSLFLFDDAKINSCCAIFLRIDDYFHYFCYFLGLYYFYENAKAGCVKKVKNELKIGLSQK